MKKLETINDYIASEPAPLRAPLKKMRSIIHAAAPRASEKLAWSMPTFFLEGNLVHFAAFTSHLSLFPGSDAIREFAPKLKAFTTSKGTIQFPYGKPIPVALVTRIVKWCVKRNLAMAKAKAARKAKKAKKSKKAKAKGTRRASKR